MLVSYTRVGSTNQKAGASQIKDLKRLNRMDSFDEQAVPNLNLEALDFRVASELFAPRKKLTPLAWKSLRVTAAFGSQSSSALAKNDPPLLTKT